MFEIDESDLNLMVAARLIRLMGGQMQGRTIGTETLDLRFTLLTQVESQASEE